MIYQCSCPDDLPIYDDINRKCVAECPHNNCLNKNCNEGVCDNTTGKCICPENGSFYGENCEKINLCIQNNVDCGIYGTCDIETGECDRCTAYAHGWGDPHYHSFDGEVTDFQGHCEYQLSGICENSNTTQLVTEKTPYFKLFARQQAKGSRSNLVTYIHGWTMEWQPPSMISTNQKIILTWDRADDKNSPVQIGVRTDNNDVNSSDLSSESSNLFKPYNLTSLTSPFYYQDYQILASGIDARHAS